MQQEKSKLFEKSIVYRAYLDTGEIISSTTGKTNPLIKEEIPPKKNISVKIYRTFVNDSRL